jgi:hypothetical protein
VYGEEDLNVKRLQKADRSNVMTIAHMVHWAYYLFAPIIFWKIEKKHKSNKQNGSENK